MAAVAAPAAIDARALTRAENEATFWRTLALRKTHPLQLWILHVAENELAIVSPKKLTDLSGGHELGNVAYHVRELHKMGMLELVKTEPRRGSEEHFYRRVAEGDAG